jgi:hypothetical protein
MGWDLLKKKSEEITFLGFLYCLHRNSLSLIASVSVRLHLPEQILCHPVK